ncbi:unnamed protein product [Plutella xylostella]|uniref:(diamondback moth) hypothetical protein n=1 Tax=Plutella xylostella TaxID=51655 RepID=A0A8S4EMM5_PLUXY|nr:unnamed protein product [Plutella xylostella]
MVRASCPSSLFHTWETLLQEVEADVLVYSNAATALDRTVATPLIDRTFHLKVQARKLFAHREGCELILDKADDQLTKAILSRVGVVVYSNAATALDRTVATPLIDRTFHLKVQARKLFAHREGCELILDKADDQLTKSRLEYRAAFLTYSNSPSPTALAAYYDSHNNYVQQLTATNAMLEQYYKHTLPTILQELEEVLTDVTTAVSDAITQKGEIMTDKVIMSTYAQFLT